MRYSEKSFTVSVGDNSAYRSNWDDIFGKKIDPQRKPEGTPSTTEDSATHVDDRASDASS